MGEIDEAIQWAITSTHLFIIFVSILGLGVRVCMFETAYVCFVFILSNLCCNLVVR